METSPTEKNLGGSDEAFDVPKDVDICRICQSPEEPNNPLKHPCACRGSLKFVHSDCLFLWINRRKRKHCEICKRSYAIAPVYSKNAPKRLSCLELLMCLLLRALSIIKVIFPWLLVIPINAYFYSSLIHSDNEDYVEDYGVFISLLNSPAIFYTLTIVSGITLMAAVILTTEMNWPLKDVTMFPQVLGYSMEKRIVPRCEIIKALLSKGLLGNELPSMAFVLNRTDELFLERYVRNHDDKQLVLELMAIFTKTRVS